MNWQQLKAHPGPRTFIEIDRLAGRLDLENAEEWRLALPEMDVFQRYVLLLAWFMQHRPMPPDFAIAALAVLPDAGDAVDMIRSIVLQSRPFTKELAEKLLDTNCWCHEAPHRMPFSGAIVQYLGERLVRNSALEQPADWWRDGKRTPESTSSSIEHLRRAVRIADCYAEVAIAYFRLLDHSGATWLDLIRGLELPDFVADQVVIMLCERARIQLDTARRDLWNGEWWRKELASRGTDVSTRFPRPSSGT